MSETEGAGALPAMDAEMEEMKRVAAERGKAGDLYAIDLSWRMRGCRLPLPVLDLPPIDDMAGVHKAQAVVIAAVAARRLTPRDALYYSTLLEHRRRAIRSLDIEARLRALEEEDDRRARAAAAVTP
jgi:hypothetical protein